jgi:deoxyribonuclease-4
MTTSTTLNSPRSRHRFGAHLSIAGGLHHALEAAANLGFDSVQIFVKNQQQWSASPLSDEQARLFRRTQRLTGVRPVIAHASYLPNLASPDSTARSRSIAAIVDELERCEALAVRHLVLHPGSHLGEGLDQGLRTVAASLDEIHRRTAGFAARLLLETTAGQGNSVGHEPWQLGRIIQQVAEPRRVGVCLDTCHLFAAGYNLADPADYARLMSELAAEIGLARIKCIHMNDSKTPCGSRVDRHEHIGKGRLGLRAFAHVVNDPRLTLAPKILETPKGVTPRGIDLDKLNLRRLRGLVRPSPRSSPVRDART